MIGPVSDLHRMVSQMHQPWSHGSTPLCNSCALRSLHKFVEDALVKKVTPQKMSAQIVEQLLFGQSCPEFAAKAPEHQLPQSAQKRRPELLPIPRVSSFASSDCHFPPTFSSTAPGQEAKKLASPWKHNNELKDFGESVLA